MGEVEPDMASVLVDLSGISLEEFGELPESVLAESLWRIRKKSAEASEPYAGFESSI